jgi:hypothetical protein
MHLVFELHNRKSLKTPKSERWAEQKGGRAFFLFLIFLILYSSRKKELGQRPAMRATKTSSA